MLFMPTGQRQKTTHRPCSDTCECRVDFRCGGNGNEVTPKVLSAVGCLRFGAEEVLVLVVGVCVLWVGLFAVARLFCYRGRISAVTDTYWHKTCATMYAR